MTVQQLKYKELTYNIGDIVFLKNDPEKKTALLVSQLDRTSELVDYELVWLNSQRKLERMQVKEPLLISPQK